MNLFFLFNILEAATIFQSRHLSNRLSPTSQQRTSSNQQQTSKRMR
jgi:hypothetical protein